MKFSFSGLTDQEVEQSRATHGSNAVTTQETETFLDKLIDNFKDPIIIILLIALVVIVGLWIFHYAEWYEGAGIAFAVMMAVLVATWSEYSNESKFQQLLEEASQILVKVFRNNQLVQININELVVGDHLLLQPGDTIPTDGVLLVGHLDVDEASLTGESEPVKKQAMIPEKPIEEHHRMFRAALVIDGEAVMKTTAVGDKTRYGETMKEIVTAEDRLSPLQQKLIVLGKQISTFGYIGAIFIFVAFMLNQIFLQTDGGMNAYLAQDIGIIIKHVVTAMILAIIIIVVSVPEGLPMVIAMVLALNMKKLLNVKVLVRKLLGIETAGSLTVLFSDKTGTLTQGQLVAEEFILGNISRYKNVNEVPEKVKEILAFALRNNTSAVIDTSDPEHPRMVGADRTEQAMLRFVTPLLGQKDNVDIVDVIMFNSSRKFSATQVKGDKALTLVKGAAEVVLQNCAYYFAENGTKMELTTKDKEKLTVQMSSLSARAMRVLAVAVGEVPIQESKELPQPLTLVGIFGMRDALRSTSYDAVKMARNAGIHVVMITGDARETAHAIATDVGLLEGDKEAKILTSTELATLSDEEVKRILPHLYVVARAFPTDKSRLVRLAKELGWVVGMTGDGVNDAPAVKNADVGFAMGSGTEMTKESSDIVILDDNFSSITRAVLYGRTLFKSIRKFLTFQLTINVSALSVSFFGQFIGIDLPLTMVQLLWINIIMDTLAGLAFAGEAALPRYMLEKPIPREERLISKDMWSAILVNGIVAAILSLFFIASDVTKEFFSGGHPVWTLAADGSRVWNEEAHASFLTAFFAFFVFMHVFNMFNVRTQSLNLFEHFFENKLFLPIISIVIVVQALLITFGGGIMRTVGLQPQEWMYILLFALVLIPVDLIRKMVRNALFGNPVLTHAQRVG